MKSLRIPMSIALTTTTLLTGCGLFTDARRNLAFESHMAKDDYAASKHHYRLAEDSLREFDRIGSGGSSLTDDFRCGYLDGFVDLLDRGGNGEPPLTPPKGYRVETYYTAEVQRGLENYYTGFRSGSRAAQSANVRSLRILPLGGPVSGEDIRRPVIYPGSGVLSTTLPGLAPDILTTSPAPGPNAGSTIPNFVPAPGTRSIPPIVVPYQPSVLPPESAPRVPSLDPSTTGNRNRIPANPTSRSPGFLPGDPGQRSLPPLPPSLRAPSPYGTVAPNPGIAPSSEPIPLPIVRELPGVQ